MSLFKRQDPVKLWRYERVPARVEDAPSQSRAVGHHGAGHVAGRHKGDLLVVSVGNATVHGESDARRRSPVIAGDDGRICYLNVAQVTDHVCCDADQVIGVSVRVASCLGGYQGDRGKKKKNSSFSAE